MKPDLTIEDLQHLCTLARSWFGTSNLIIAGGAPRDILHGKPVKDIDIFVQVEPEDLESPDVEITDAIFGEVHCAGDSKFVQSCKHFAEHVCRGKAVFRQSPESYGGLADLCDIEVPGGYPVQIIALFNDPVDDVHDYDFGLSQVFVTPRGVFFTPAYRLDDSCREITYIDKPRDEHAMERSRKRLARLQEKYYDWPFSNTTVLDKLPTEEIL